MEEVITREEFEPIIREFYLKVRGSKPWPREVDLQWEEFKKAQADIGHPISLEEAREVYGAENFSPVFI